MPFTFSSPAQRALLLAAIVVFSAAVGVWAGLREAADYEGVAAVRMFGSGAIFAALPAFTLALAVYSAAWHIACLRMSAR